MTGTSATSNRADLSAKTVPLAMLAVAQHAIDHHLSTWRIEHTSWTPADGILVGVDRQQLDAWLDTVTVLDEPAVRRGTGLAANVEMVSYPALLPSPIGDVRITVVSSRQVVGLHLVGDAS